MMKELFYFAFILVIFVFSNFDQILAQNETMDILLRDILERQKESEETTSKNELLIQITRTELDEFKTDTKIEIQKIDESSRLWNLLNVVGTVIAVFFSGYLGFHIHKREFNAELSRNHFDDIKQEIFHPLKKFVEDSIRFNEPHSSIFHPSLETILENRSMNFHNIRFAQEQERLLESRELNVSLLEDTIFNHYGMVENDMRHVVTHALRHNKTRKEISKGIANYLEPFVKSKCTIISASEFHKEKKETDVKSENYFLLNEFTDNLTNCILGGFKEEDFQIVKHLDGKALSISAPESQQYRYVYPKDTDINECETLIRGCISKIFHHAKIIEKVNESLEEFNQFRSSLDMLSQNIDKILNKTILRTKKKLLFLSACDYIRE